MTRAHALLAALLMICAGCSDPGNANQANAQKKPLAQDETHATVRQETVAANQRHGAAELPAPSDDAKSLSPRPDDWFLDLTLQAGVDFTYRNGREAGHYYFPESLGGGAAMIDYDLDGDLDLFFAGGGTFAGQPPRAVGLPSAMYRNNGGFSFAAITAVAWLDEPPDYSHGCAVSDFDRDGFEDLFLCCYGRSRLYRNLGDGTFAEACDAAQLPAHGWGTAAVFADADGDDWPDLFLLRYVDWSVENDIRCENLGVRDVCGPGAYPNTSGLYFHNAGDGTFEDWSERMGLKPGIKGLGVLAADLNGDGLVDFYVASDETPNQLYLLTRNRTFQEAAVAAGVAFNEYGDEEGSMGVDVGDVDGDGLPDLWVTNFELEDHALYRNLGNGTFSHATVAAGLAGRSRLRVGFGTGLADFDGDGWLDIFVTNGSPLYTTGRSPYLQLPQLFANQGGLRFREVTQQGGTYFRTLHAGRGAMVGDLDDDGAQDIVLTHVNEPVVLLRNRLPAPNVLRLRLRGAANDVDAMGAVVLAPGPGGRVLSRFNTRGAGYFSHGDTRLLFPLPATQETVDVTVKWPGRSIERFEGLASRQMHWLREGTGLTPQ
jgi:hypothetical protein